MHTLVSKVYLWELESERLALFWAISWGLREGPGAFSYIRTRNNGFSDLNKKDY